MFFLSLSINKWAKNLSYLSYRYKYKVSFSDDSILKLNANEKKEEIFTYYSNLSLNG